MGNMYMRTRYILESDPHFNRPLPEPSEQAIWKYIVTSPSYAKIFLDMQPDEIENVFAVAQDSGVLRGLQVYHNYLNEKLTVPEQNLEAR